MVLGLPIYLVLILTSITAIVFVADMPLVAMPTYMFGSLDNFPLLAVPYFVLAGEIMSQGSIARRVVAWVVSIIGGIRGSLAVTTVASSELFGAMAHTSVGTVVAVGRLIYPSLRESGYSERFSIGLITSSGAVAVIIPPSIAMILYSMTAQESALALFTAGVLPSILIGLDRRRLRVLLFAHQGGAATGPRALGQHLGDDQGCELGDRHRGGDLRRHLQRRVHPDRGRGRGRGLFVVRHHRDLSRTQPRRSLARAAQLRVPDLADPHHRRRRRALFLAADDQRHSAAGGGRHRVAAYGAVGDAAAASMSACCWPAASSSRRRPS